MIHNVKFKIEEVITDFDEFEKLNAEKGIEFLESNGGECAVSIYELDGVNAMILCAYSYNYAKGNNLEDSIKKYMNILELKGEIVNCEEITTKRYSNLSAVRIRLGQPTLHKFDVDESLFENLVREDDYSTSSCYREIVVPNHCYEGTSTVSVIFRQEVERIKACHQSFNGHPVHYLISFPNLTRNEDTINNLIYTLYSNQRLLSKKKFILLHDNDDRIAIKTVESIVQFAAGATVIIDCLDQLYPVKTFSEKDTYLEELADLILRYQHDTLFILIALDPKGEVIQQLMSQLAKMVIVEIKEMKLDHTDAVHYMSELVKQKNIPLELTSAPAELLNSIQCYSENEISEIFGKWHQNYLIESVYPSYSIFKKKVSSPAVATTGKAYQNLQELIGLDEIKELVDEFITTKKAQEHYINAGASQIDLGMHMIFSGNPGTAKTTVARLLGQILRDNHILEVGEVFEVSRTDLIEKYVGWTAKRVTEYFEEARGSILFIDEAYSLLDDPHSFGDEAIDTIVLEMENHRNDVMVIFAGYPREMENFINRNSGLRSRINYQLNFRDYNLTQLIEIGYLMIQNRGLKISEKAKSKLKKLLEAGMKKENYGNGRFVRKVLDQAILRHGSNLCKVEQELSKEVILTLDADDFMIQEESEERIQLRSNTKVCS